MTNTDTTTDLNVASTTVTVPFGGGTEVFMDSSFFTSGEGIACNYNGRVKVTSSIHLFDPTGQRPNVLLDIEINGVSQGVLGASGYIRNSGGHQESSVHVTIIGTCVLGHIITVTTLAEATGGVTVMNDVGTSMQLVNRH